MTIVRAVFSYRPCRQLPRQPPARGTQNVLHLLLMYVLTHIKFKKHCGKHLKGQRIVGFSVVDSFKIPLILKYFQGVGSRHVIRIGQEEFESWLMPSATWHGRTKYQMYVWDHLEKVSPVYSLIFDCFHVSNIAISICQGNPASVWSLSRTHHSLTPCFSLALSLPLASVRLSLHASLSWLLPLLFFFVFLSFPSVALLFFLSILPLLIYLPLTASLPVSPAEGPAPRSPTNSNNVF